MKIIVGLGNPGKEYEKTAHNIGFRIIENLVQSSKFNPFDKLRTRVQNQSAKFKIENKLKSEICGFDYIDEKVLLVKPQTFMNRSGEAVGAVLNFYKVDLSDLIVVYDDADLPLGKIKIQKGGGSAGHHGMESIIKSIGESDFTRIRVGIRIGKDKAGAFVLTSFGEKEQRLLEEMIEKAAEAVKMILEKGIIPTMDRYNGEN